MDELIDLINSITTEKDEAERLVLVNEMRTKVDTLIGDNIHLKEELETMTADRDKWHTQSYEYFHQLGSKNMNLQGSNPANEPVEITSDNIGNLFF